MHQFCKDLEQFTYLLSLLRAPPYMLGAVAFAGRRVERMRYQRRLPAEGVAYHGHDQVRKRAAHSFDGGTKLLGCLSSLRPS